MRTHTRHRTAKTSLKKSLASLLPGKAAATGSKKRKQGSKPKAEEPKAGPAINYETRDALPRPAKLQELDRQLKVTQSSTASLGKYDNKLKGEQTRPKGIKRQFESNQIDSKTEHERYLAALDSLEEDEAKKRRKAGATEEGSNVVNARKAIRNASGGKGSASLAGEEKKKASYSSKSKGGAGKTRSSAGKRK